MNVSERQRAIYWFIVNHVRDEGYQPSFREIGEAFGLKSTNSVTQHLAALEKEGYVERLRDAPQNRALRLPKIKFEPVPRPTKRLTN